MTADLGLAVLAMALAAYACRAFGFLAMGWVPLSARVRAWLMTVPTATLAAVVAVALLHGGAAEWLGTVVTLAVMRLTGSDLAAAGLGVGTVAAGRFFLA